jgi:hypothetical protein
VTPLVIWRLVTELLDLGHLGLEAEIVTRRDFSTLHALLHHAVSRIDRWWDRHTVAELLQAPDGQT